MKTVTWLSFWIAVAGVALGGIALLRQFRDKPRLKVVRIHPELKIKGQIKGQVSTFDITGYWIC